ncbi:hypothetical protein R1T08_15005 [Streptomyces sp. SBC-4]|nr:hypothetical protein [Streptomyces sp. SBC-4]MDV5145486.1 hypothetical protein [Streptomyces sp. SBC-4]
MNAYLFGYVALSLAVTAHWYGSRLYRLGLRTGHLLVQVQDQATSAARRRLRRFLSEDGDGHGDEMV